MLQDSRHLSRVADSPVPMVLSDPRLPDNPIIAVNAPFCILTGYPAEEVIGRNCRFLSGPATDPAPSAELVRGLRERRPVSVELLNYKRSGQPFRNSVLIDPIHDGLGRLLYFLGSQIEIDTDVSRSLHVRRLRATERLKPVSARQGQVLRFVAQGLLNKEIAAELGLAEKTVKMHRAILMKRLGVKTVADLVRLAVEAGL